MILAGMHSLHIFFMPLILEIRFDGKILVIIIMQRYQRGSFRNFRQQEFRKTLDGFDGRHVGCLVGAAAERGS